VPTVTLSPWHWASLLHAKRAAFAGEKARDWEPASEVAVKGSLSQFTSLPLFSSLVAEITISRYVCLMTKNEKLWEQNLTSNYAISSPALLLFLVLWFLLQPSRYCCQNKHLCNCARCQHELQVLIHRNCGGISLKSAKCTRCFR